MTQLLYELGLSQFEIITLTKLLVSAVCGGLIGLEREMKGSPAGLKTFSLVCIGSTLAMVTNEYIYTYVTNATGDISRMAAQVISGIGFLGAGTIMVTGRNQVRGLTTAASLWVTASIGIAVGAGFYFGGIAGVVIIFIFSMIYRMMDKKIAEKSQTISIYVEGKNEKFLLRLAQYFSNNEISIVSLDRNETNKLFLEGTSSLMELKLKKKQSHETLISELKNIKGVFLVEEIK